MQPTPQWVQDEQGNLYQIVAGMVIPFPPVPSPGNQPAVIKETSRFYLAAGLIGAVTALAVIRAFVPNLSSQDFLLGALVTGATNAVSFYFGSKRG